jgi:hypothetical protein
MASLDKTSQTVSDFVPFSPKFRISRQVYKYFFKPIDIGNSLVNTNSRTV